MAVDLISSIVDRANVSKQLQDTTTELQANYKALVDNIQAAALLNSVLGKSQGQKDFVRAQEQINQALLKNQALQEKIAQTAAQAEERIRQEKAKTAQQEERLEAQRAARARAEDARQAKALKDVQKQSGAYAQLLEVYRQLTEQARNAGVQFGVNSYQFQELSQQANGVRQRLDSIDQPLGNFQRNVGNYFGSLGTIFSRFYGYIRVAANIIPGLGISGIFLAAFEGLKYVAEQLDLFSTKTTTAQNNLKNLNEVASAASKQYGEQATNLRILYKAATDITNAEHDRVLAARELQKEFPDTFRNIKIEAILNGEASDSYKQLTKDIIDNAKARAAATKIQELAAKQLQSDFKVQKINNAEINELKRLSKSLDANGNLPGIPGEGGGGIAAGNADKQIKDRAERSRKIEAQNKKELQDQIDFLTAFAGGNNKIAKALSTNDTPKDKVVKPKNTALEILNDQLEQAKNIRDRILQDENSSYDDRLKALYTYEHDTENLILAAENRKTITRLDAGNRAAEIEQDSDKKRVELAKAAQKELQDLAKDQLEFQKDYNKQIQTVAEDLNTKATTKLLDEAQDSANEQLAILADQYKRGEITTQQYNDRKAEIERQANLNSQALTIAGLEQLIEIRKMFGLNEADDERKLADLKRKLSKDTLSAQLSDLDKLNAEKKKGRDAEKTAAKALGDELLTLGKTLVDAQFTNQLNAIQAQKDALDDQTSAQIDAINREVGSNADKADKIAIINAKAAAQQRQLDQQARKIKHDQAVADRAFAIATIIENTAIGVSKALAEYIFPYSAIVAGLVGALGAAQIATVLATPVPAYADGTDFHPGGMARIGEAGRELVIEPGKSPWMTNGDVTRPLARGTQVISNRELIAATMSLGTIRDRESIPWGDLIKATKESRANVNVKPRVSGWLAEQRKAETFNNYRKNHFN